MFVFALNIKIGNLLHGKKDVEVLTGGGSDDAEYSLEAYSTGLTTIESASFSILASIVNPDMSRYV